MTSIDLKAIKKKNDWNFNWNIEFKDIKKEVYKLTIVNNSNIIHTFFSKT